MALGVSAGTGWHLRGDGPQYLVSDSQLFTIGYGGRTIDQFVDELKANDVDRVIDVRALPLSRRRGFSKTPLRTALAAAGIEYVHLRNAGNPYRHEDDKIGLYQKYLDATPSVVGEVFDAANGHRAALLCAEREPAECHRSNIASALRRRKRMRVTHL